MPRTSTAASAAKATEVVEESIFDAPVSKPTPAPKQAAKFKVRREEKEKSVSEYKTVKKSGSIFIMAQKNVTIIDDGRVREIRYCPSERSIFKDEQESDARRAPVMFTEGRIFVRPDQPNLKEFLDRHPDNTANGGKRFYLVDETKQKKVEIEKEYVMVDAINMIRTRPLDDLLAVAQFILKHFCNSGFDIRHYFFATFRIPKVPFDGIEIIFQGDKSILIDVKNNAA